MIEIIELLLLEQEVAGVPVLASSLLAQIERVYFWISIELLLLVQLVGAARLVHLLFLLHLVHIWGLVQGFLLK